MLENRDGDVARVARRSLFALSCDTGSVLDFEPRLLIRDFDGDGDIEVQVRLPIAAVRPDGARERSPSPSPTDLAPMWPRLVG